MIEGETKLFCLALYHKLYNVCLRCVLLIIAFGYNAITCVATCKRLFALRFADNCLRL